MSWLFQAGIPMAVNGGWNFEAQNMLSIHHKTYFTWLHKASEVKQCVCV